MTPTLFLTWATGKPLLETQGLSQGGPWRAV